MNSKIDYVTATTDLSETSLTDGVILNQTASQHTRLVSLDKSGKPCHISRAAKIGIRHIHDGNMYHHPGDSTDFLDWLQD